MPLDLRKLVRGRSDLISSTVGPRISTNYGLEGDLPITTTDANKLEMALLNLCVNSRDARPEAGQLELPVRLRQVTFERSALEAGAYVCIIVEIPAAVWTRTFVSVRQTPSSRPKEVRREPVLVSRWSTDFRFDLGLVRKIAELATRHLRAGQSRSIAQAQAEGVSLNAIVSTFRGELRRRAAITNMGLFLR